MCPDVVKGVYLSGWEYNRLLQDDLFQPRISALPGEILWNGGAYFWMFEEVWCTKESLDNEIASATMMGWATGRIFEELALKGILRPLDWKADLNQVTKGALERAHRSLREGYGSVSKPELRTAIENRDIRTLENLKMRLLTPIGENLGLALGSTPNSLELPEWRGPANTPTIAAQKAVRDFLSKVAQPVVKLNPDNSLPTGIRLCNPPGTGLSDAVKQEQKRIQREHEAPMISELLAGEGQFTGAEGFVPYFAALTQHKHAYDAINIQLLRDWKENVKRLTELRQAAKKHLWPALHEEWLPQIMADPTAGARLSPKIAAATRLLGHLDMPTTLAITTVPVGTFGLARTLTEMTNLSMPTATAVATATGSAATLAIAANKELRDIIKDLKNRRNLALFYQQAKAISNRTK